MGQCGAKVQSRALKSDETASVVHVDEDSSETTGDVSDTLTLRDDSTREQSLLSVRFERTLFCGDITYQYEVSCDVEGIESWTLRLTVEDLTAFFVETFSKWEGCHDAQVPDQCGKVMRPETFTECLERVLAVPAMLKSQDTSFSEATADLLSIPYGVRPVIQYDAEQFESAQTLDVAATLGDQLEDKCLYLSHHSATYSPKDLAVDRGFSPKMSFYPTTTASSTSYWLRVLPQKTDLLVTFSCGAFYVVMSECTMTIAAALLESVSCLDADCAWTVADYLPKQLFLSRSDRRRNAQIVYRCAEEDGEDGRILSNALDAVSMKQLEALCRRIEQHHLSAAAESDESLSEFLELASDSCPESEELEFPRLEKLSSNDSTDSGFSLSLESREVDGSRDVNALPFFELSADKLVED